MTIVSLLLLLFFTCRVTSEKGFENVNVNDEELQQMRFHALNQFHAFHQLEDIIKRYQRESPEKLQMTKGASQALTSNDLLDSSEPKNDHYPTKIGAQQGLLLHKDNNQKLSVRGPPALPWAKDNIRGITHPGFKKVNVYDDKMQSIEFPALHRLKDIIKRYQTNSRAALQLTKGGSLASTSNDLLDSSEVKNDHHPIKIGARQGLPLHKDSNEKLSLRGPPALHWAKDNIQGLTYPGEQALKLGKDDHPS